MRQYKLFPKVFSKRKCVVIKKVEHAECGYVIQVNSQNLIEQDIMGKTQNDSHWLIVHS